MIDWQQSALYLCYKNLDGIFDNIYSEQDSISSNIRDIDCIAKRRVRLKVPSDI